MATLHRFATPNAVAIAGMLSLAIRVGIGRFAFTPMLPLMIQGGHLEISWGGWLAAANYLGYFVGALLASRMAANSAALGVLSLLSVVLTTSAMALEGLPLWMVLRFLAGVFSAWVFVATSVWCLGTLGRLQRQDLGGWVYSGVGVGIVVAGVYCFLAGISGTGSQQSWLELAALGLALCVPVCLTLLSIDAGPLTGGGGQLTPAPVPDRTAGLVICYGLMGLGYILPATFLPVMARAIVSDPAVFGLAWPVYGATAALSTVIGTSIMRRTSRLAVWAASQFLMGIGVLLPSLAANRWAIFTSAVLVGGTFMVITLAGVQEMRARVSSRPGVWVGYMTAAFAFGQIAGAATPAALLAYPATAPHALALCLQVAAAALFISALWLWRLTIPLSTTKKELANAR
jgi:MFS family permease